MITQISIKHYKAINECNKLSLQAFTAFIGNNGSGKSSAIEALRTLHLAVTDNLEAAFEISKSGQWFFNGHLLEFPEIIKALQTCDLCLPILHVPFCEIICKTL